MCIYSHLYLFIPIYFWTYTDILKSIYVQMGFKVSIFKRADFMNTEWFAITERRTVVCIWISLKDKMRCNLLSIWNLCFCVWYFIMNIMSTPKKYVWNFLIYIFFLVASESRSVFEFEDGKASFGVWAEYKRHITKI